MVTSSSRDHGDAGIIALWVLLLSCFISTSAHPSPKTKDMPPNFDTHIALACFSQSRGSIDLICPAHPVPSMVRIEQVSYHYAPEGTCLPSPVHCTYAAPELEVYPCVGRGSCAINTPTGGQGPELMSCQGNWATYMTVKYQCIPVSEVIDVCHTPNLTSQWGFVTSPRYPLNYLPSTNCTLRLRAPHMSQRLHVRLIDLRLENSDAKCSDWLQLFDGHRSETYCNVRTDHPAMTTFSNYLELKFRTDANSTWKGFWLYYEAFPYIDDAHLLHAQPITTTKHAKDVESKETTTPSFIHPSVYNPKSNNSTKKPLPALSEKQRQQAHDSLTVGIIVGVVLGVLLCITVVLAVVLFLRK